MDLGLHMILFEKEYDHIMTTCLFFFSFLCSVVQIDELTTEFKRKENNHQTDTLAHWGRPRQ